MTPNRRDVLCAGLAVGTGLLAAPAGSTPASLTIDEASTDFGRLVTRKPRAVDRPASDADVARLLREAAANGVKVAPRGQGHSIYGRPLVEDGMVVDMGALSAVGEVAADRVTVEAGTTWRGVLDATLKHGLAPPVLTNYLGLSVGGTVAVGGIGGSSSRHGFQTDQVLELEVETVMAGSSAARPPSIAICSTPCVPGSASAPSSPAPPCGSSGRPSASAASSSSIATCQRLPPTSVACWMTAASPSCRAPCFPIPPEAGATSSTARCSTTATFPPPTGAPSTAWRTSAAPPS